MSALKTVQFFLILKKITLDFQLLKKNIKPVFTITPSLFKAIKRNITLQSSSMSQTKHTCHYEMSVSLNIHFHAS